MKPVDDILLSLHQKLSGVSGSWMIIGTASLYLLGYPVKPNDIDILTDTITAKEIEQALLDYKVDTNVKPNDKFRSAFSEYVINGFKIEVMGNLEVNTPDGWVLLREQIREIENVLFNGMLFRIPARESQIDIYTLFNRGKDMSVLEMLNP